MGRNLANIADAMLTIVAAANFILESSCSKLLVNQDDSGDDPEASDLLLSGLAGELSHLVFRAGHPVGLLACANYFFRYTSGCTPLGFARFCFAVVLVAPCCQGAVLRPVTYPTHSISTLRSLGLGLC